MRKTFVALSIIAASIMIAGNVYAGDSQYKALDHEIIRKIGEVGKSCQGQPLVSVAELLASIPLDTLSPGAGANMIVRILTYSYNKHPELWNSAVVTPGVSFSEIVDQTIRYFSGQPQDRQILGSENAGLAKSLKKISMAHLDEKDTCIASVHELEKTFDIGYALLENRNQSVLAAKPGVSDRAPAAMVPAPVAGPAPLAANRRPAF